MRLSPTQQPAEQGRCLLYDNVLSQSTACQLHLLSSAGDPFLSSMASVAQPSPATHASSAASPTHRSSPITRCSFPAQNQGMSQPPSHGLHSPTCTILDAPCRAASTSATGPQRPSSAKPLSRHLPAAANSSPASTAPLHTWHHRREGVPSPEDEGLQSSCRPSSCARRSSRRCS